MADLSLIRAGAFDALHAVSLACPAASLRPLPPMARFVFRGRPEAVEAAGSAFGVTLPQTVCRAASDGERAALWLGPDEWLLLAPEQAAPGIEDRLTTALAGLPHSLVAVGHRNTALEISGPRAAPVLNAGCPLDLDLASFPVGMCTRTILAKAEIVLWRTAPETFHIEVWRSFAAFVWRFLEVARREFG